MITLDVAQGSAEWRAARLGIPTSSAFDRIITPKTLTYAARAEGYRNELLAEWLLGEPLDDGFTNGWTDRGKWLEGEARSWYAFQKDVEVVEVGFCLTDARDVGCSPDGLVGQVGGLEIKCPAAHTHVGYLLDPGSLVEKYRTQVQGSLWLTGREWWDVVSYNPAIEPVVERVIPDPAFQEAFTEHMATFLAELAAAKEALAERGVRPREHVEPVMMPWMRAG